MNRNDSKWVQRGWTAEWWDQLTRGEREMRLAELTPREVDEFFYDWRVWARDDQLAPDWDWDTWLMLAGRGWGKTRTAVEFINDKVQTAKIPLRIAIVGQGEDDIRTVMVEGESGFINCAPPWNKPEFYPSKGGGVLIWPNGCQAFIHSAADSEGLRGPQFHYGWFDEPMAVPRAQRERSFDNLEFCLRLGEHPQLVVTTTPKPDPWLREMEKQAKNPEESRIAISRGSTHDNKRNLAANFLRKIERKYGGTKKGKQEIEGKILGDEEGALWTEEVLDRCRMEDVDPLEFAESCEKVLVSIDPNTKGVNGTPAANKKKLAHAAGIIVSGKIGKKRYILADRTCTGGPAKWGKAAVLAAMEFDADEFTAEGNQGGEMVKIVLQQAMQAEEFHIPVHINWSKRSKQARAEPVSTVYERGEVYHVGPKSAFEDLEMQMMYLHEGEDPTSEDFDRVDALVSGLTRHGLKRRFSSAKGGGKGAGIRTIGEITHGANQAGSFRGHAPDWDSTEL